MSAIGARLKARAPKRSARLNWSARLKPSVLYLVAAALTAAALAVPLWGFAMSAPQYPDETLHLQVARTGIGGDVREVETLQQYIGVRFPTELPELRLATRAIAVLSVLLLVAAFTRARGIGRAYRALCLLAVMAFLAASAVAVQARLYRVGHERDRKAPIRAIHDFTPPLVGPVKVGNFTVWSFPHVGAALLLTASVLSIIGVRLKPDATDDDPVRLKPDTPYDTASHRDVA
jgi:copper chaperone NosL